MHQSGRYEWDFKPRFRRGAFGWRSQPAVKRVKEAVSEICKVARREPLLAADGAVCFLERVSPALKNVDSSSGAIGSAVNHAIKTLIPIIGNSEVNDATRRKWLSRLWDAIRADETPYIEVLDEHWGELCATEEIASEWADDMLSVVRLNATHQDGGYFRGTRLCFEALYKARRYEELLELLHAPSFRFDWYQAYAVKTLLTLGRNEEAFKTVDACKRDSVNGTPAIDQVLIEFNLVPPPPELTYGSGAFEVLRQATYVGWYRAVAEKFPEKQPSKIIRDLIATSPGAEGKWFTTAKELGMLQLAISLANTSLCDPRTLSRAARDYLDKDQQFAMDAGRASLHWYLQGYGFDVEASDVRSALAATLQAAAQLGETERIKTELRSVVEPKLKRRSKVAGWLAPMLGLSPIRTDVDHQKIN